MKPLPEDQPLPLTACQEPSEPACSCRWNCRRSNRWRFGSGSRRRCTVTAAAAEGEGRSCRCRCRLPDRAAAERPREGMG